jgi:hypothetical protein
MIYTAVALGVGQAPSVEQAAFLQTSTGVAALLTLAGALVAAWIGGCMTSKATLEAVRESAQRERELREEEQRIEVNNYRKSIISEIQSLWSQYMLGIGEHLEKAHAGQPFEMFYPVYQNYFGVYDGNMATLAKIEDDQERELIIDAYLTAKGLVDSYAFNNKLLDGLSQLMVVPKLTGAHVDELRVGTVNALREYCGILKAAHTRTRDKKDKLLAMLRQKLEQEH